MPNLRYVLILPLLALAWLGAVSDAARAQSVAPIDTLFRALGLPEIIEIMRDEGLEYGTELQDDLLAGRGGADWRLTVSRIYDQQRMADTVRHRLDAELAMADLAPMIGFYISEQGRRIVALEVSARRALLDAGVEEASREALSAMISDDDPRLKLLEDFADAGELVELNVVGAMNSNYAFYTGLAEGGAFPGEMSEQDIVADIWGQEEMIRTDTEEWLFSYLALAYRPLSSEELSDYIEFMASPEGAKLNRAIFAAFDEMFVAVSLALGQSAAQLLSAQEL